MPSTALWAGALSLLLIHSETGCTHAARHAARLLECLGESEGLDDNTRHLCERASQRLSHPNSLATNHA